MYLTPETRDALADLGPVALAPGRKVRGGSPTVGATPVDGPLDQEGWTVATCGRAIITFPVDLWDSLRGLVAEPYQGTGRMTLRPLGEGERDQVCLVRVSTNANN